MDPYTGDCWNNFKFINHNGVLPTKNTKKLPIAHYDMFSNCGYCRFNSAIFLHFDRSNIL